ncbi:MAG: hypothetical protein WCL14_05510 [Bacteroidota bacterium]
MKYNSKRQRLILVLTYIHFNNFFESSTVNSFVKMARISTYMDQNLQEAGITDPIILALYGIFHPQHVAFMLLYTTWRGTGGVLHGKVFTKNELLAELVSTDLAEWDLQVQMVYRKGTEEYNTIFPQGHKPFVEGTIDDRIAAILVLRNVLVSFPLLAALHTTVSGFYTSIFNAESLVAGKKGVKTSSSGALETGRVTNATNMHKMFGSLLKLYSGNDVELGRYVDVEEIQAKQEVNPIERTIVTHRKDKVASRTLLATDHFEITNDGLADLKFYLLKHIDDTPSVFVTVPAGQTLAFPATALGNINYRYIMCENDSLTVNGHYSFLFVD